MKNDFLRNTLTQFFIVHWTILAVVVLWMLFSSPYFLQGLVPYPSTYQVNHFPPWSYYEKYWGPVKNGAMPDVTDQIYPWRYFTIQSWLNGYPPSWNPYSFAGNPHIANFQSAAFSPFNILFALFPFIDAWSLLVLLQPLIAGIGTFLYVRSLGTEKSGAALSAVAFMFCGFMVTWMAYGTLSMAIALLPWTLFALERSFQKYSHSIGFLVSLCIAASVFSGHFQTSVYLILLSVFYYLFKVFYIRDKKHAWRILSFIMLGVVISLVQVIPSVRLYGEAVRSEIFIASGGIPPQYMVTIFAPDFYGNPVTRNDWFGQYAEWASFVGIIPLTLALFSFYIIRRNKTVFFFWLVTLVTLFLAIQSPVLGVLGALKIPVLSTSTPSRIIVLTSFSFVVLGGFGMKVLIDLVKQSNVKKILPVILAVGVLLLLIWVWLLFFPGFTPDRIAIAQRNMILPTVLLGVVSAVLAAGLLNKRVMIILPVFFIILSAADSLRFAQKWMPFDARHLVFPDVPVITAMQENIGYGRYFGNLGNQVSTYYNLASIEGYDPLYSERLGEFLRGATEGEYEPAERSVAKLVRTGRYVERAIDILGVTVIFHPIADTNQSWAFPVWNDIQRYSLIYSDDKFQLFRNNGAVNRPSLFYEYEVVRSKEESIRRFYAEDFDFKNVLILEEDPEISKKETSEIAPSGNAEIISFSPNIVEIAVTSSAPGFLFLSDTYYPTWRVTVNGRDEKILRADHAFRAVRVPAGQSTVVFRNAEYF